MSFLDEFLRGVGALWDRTHIIGFGKDSAPGIFPRFTRDLRPVPETGLTGGHLLELYAVFDRRHTLDANPHLRFDVLEEDWLFTGGLDDRVASLLGTGANPPPQAGPTRRLATQVHDLPAGRDVAGFVEEYKCTLPGFEDTILVIRENPTDTKPGERRTHVIAWFRLEHQAGDIGEHSEFYFVVDLNDTVHASSPVIELVAAPPGVSVRVTGFVTDVEPLVAAQPEPLADIPVTLGGRRAVSADDGAFVIDARLNVGNHQLRLARPGIDTVDLTVEVTADAQGVVTAAVLDPDGNQVVSRSTPQPATEASLIQLQLDVNAPIALRVHKLRGTVLWPDSRPGDVPANYSGTPLAERTVYVLPLLAAGPLSDHRPKTTAQWEMLKQNPSVLRSARPGQQALRQRTDKTGAFEVKYVHLAEGNRFLIWVERFDPRDAADTTGESPDHIVRTFQTRLIQLDAPNLATTGKASRLVNVPPGPAGLNRNLIDHEYNLTRVNAGVVANAEAETVAWGADALRVALFAPGGLTLVRPKRGANRAVFDTEAALAPRTGEEFPIPTPLPAPAVRPPGSRTVEGLRLQVLPLVPLHETADKRGRAAQRVVGELSAAAAASFPDGFDVGRVSVALDATRLEQAIDLVAAALWGPLEPDKEARKVKLLESTLVVRPLLGVGAGQRLTVDQARWHIDAFSLADFAFVSLRNVPDPKVGDRQLDAAVVPVLGSVVPLLPSLPPRRVYLAPGHGLWADTDNQGSDLPQFWVSDRGGYSANAGEDEVDALMAAHAAHVVERNGGAFDTCRELADFTKAGIRNVPAAPWFLDISVGANQDFPRLWQQNPVYYFLRQRDPIVTGNAARRAPGPPPPPPPPPPAPDLVDRKRKNSHGISTRTDHMRLRAKTFPRVDLIVAMHTNALAGGTRGTLTLYLNAEPAGGGAGEGNPLGLSFATHLSNRLVARLRTDDRGVTTMRGNQGGAIGDLIETFDHGWLDDTTNPNSAPDRRVADGPLGGPVPANHVWETNQFRVGANPVRIPVALAEVAFHDNVHDSRLLACAWFRRRASEAIMLAVDDQLREDRVALDQAQVQKVLGRVFGDTPAVQNVYVPPPPFPPPPPPPATAAWARTAVTNVAADPGALASASLGAVAASALAAARGFTRADLVTLLRERVKLVAGWENGDPAPDIEKFVEAPIRGAVLARPGQPPTRAEAGVLISRTVGLTTADLAAAEARPVGPTGQPLVRAAPVPTGRTTYFARLEADLVAQRLDTLRPNDVYHVADAWLADASWSALDSPRGSRVFELDAQTPLVVVVETAGVAWKTAGQGGAEELKDIEIRVDAAGRNRTLACTFRDGRLAVSDTWTLDLPSTANPMAVTVELRANHRTKGWLSVGTKRVRVKVHPVAA